MSITLSGSSGITTDRINVDTTYDEAGTSGPSLPFGMVELDPPEVYGLLSGLETNKLDAAEIVAPGDAPKYVCRAWVNFDGVNITTDYGLGTNGIRGMGNVSSVTSPSTGFTL